MGVDRIVAWSILVLFLVVIAFHVSMALLKRRVIQAACVSGLNKISRVCQMVYNWTRWRTLTTDESAKVRALMALRRGQQAVSVCRFLAPFFCLVVIPTAWAVFLE